MPSVDVAMARSLRGGVWGSITGSVATSLARRDIVGQANDFKTAFSSWDNCMQVTYCKWPVIAVIIVGGLIVLSIVWCIARCLCCGLSCCCSCCACLKCCGNCCGMCDPPKGTPHKHLDDSYSAAPSQGYRTQAPMNAPFAPLPSHHEPPQYAEFDMAKKSPAHDDSLPAMPSWDTAGSKKVMLDDDPMELEQLKKPDNGSSSLMSGTTAAGPSSPMNQSNLSPYGQPGQASSSGYLSNMAPATDPYGQAYGQNGSAYGRSSPQLDQYGVAVGGMAAGQGRRSPYQDYAQDPMGAGYNQRSPQGQGYDNYGQDISGQSTGPQSYGYGMGQGQRSPPRHGSPALGVGGYQNNGMRRSPAPQNDDYGVDQSYDQYGQRDQYSSSGGYGRAYPPAPQRQYSSESQRPLAQRNAHDRQYSDEAASPSLQNSGGFDFNSGSSRPQQYDYSRRPSGPQQQQSQQSGRGAYPGYRTYQG